MITKAFILIAMVYAVRCGLLDLTGDTADTLGKATGIGKATKGLTKKLPLGFVQNVQQNSAIQQSIQGDEGIHAAAMDTVAEVVEKAAKVKTKSLLNKKKRKTTTTEAPEEEEEDKDDDDDEDK